MKLVKVRVRYAGLLAEIVGKSYEHVEVPEGTSVEALVEMLSQRNMNLKKWLETLPLLHVFVNNVEITGLKKYHLRDGEEVVLMPPLYEGG